VKGVDAVDDDMVACRRGWLIGERTNNDQPLMGAAGQPANGNHARQADDKDLVGRAGGDVFTLTFRSRKLTFSGPTYKRYVLALSRCL